MCGIAALFAYGEMAPPVDREELQRIRDRMATRGPDGAGEWFSPDGRVGLAHRRLSIIDLSEAGAEPMFSADDSLALVFNGEIYNYLELRQQLVAEGYQFKSHCDAEVLLALYQTRDIDAMMNALRGMYAFAIWDKKKQGMLLGRDPFGIKPLYYSDNGRTFRLASQVKALRAGGNIDLAPEPAGHVGFFLWGHVPDPYTMFRNIRSVPAGSTMWVDGKGARSPRVFCDIRKILSEAETPEAQHAFTRDGKEWLRSTLHETVRYHMVADVPVGVFLSAGLDSTTIAALAAEQGGTLRTVTLGFEEYKGTQSDETPMAEQFAQRCGAQHQTIWVSRADFEAERDHLFDSMDRPSIDGVNAFFVSLAARQANLKVALSGVGGDELFATYPSFRDIPRTVGLLGPLSGLLQPIGRDLRIVSAPLLKRLTSPKYAGTFEYGGNYSGAYLLRRGLFMPWELPELLDPDLAREGWKELQTLSRLEQTIEGISNPRLRVSALELSWYMRHQLLRDSDWAGMGHSVEIRVPLVDIDFFKQIAPLLARPGAPSKRDMAVAASSLIDPQMLDRRKTGFQIPVRDWLLTDTPAHAIDSPHRIADRGLRGWAKHVYRRFGGGHLRTRTVMRRKPAAAPVTNKIEQNGAHPEPRRVLVYRIGQLGDTIVSVPAMWVARKAFPNAHFALLCDRHPGKSHVVASDLLRGSKIFDDYLSYPVSEEGIWLRRGRMAKLLAAIRAKRFDTLVYLAPSNRKPEQIARDHQFFRMAGIQNFIGMHGFEAVELKQPNEPLLEAPLESELLLRRLEASGLKISPADRTCTDLGLTKADGVPVDAWLSQLPSDGGRVWIAVGPGSKMPAKRWPLRRFEQLVQELITEFDIWPVIFGGEEDRLIGDWLVQHWGRGYNSAGALGIRSSLAALTRCRFFVGNDTGTMHMAAAVGLPCVAIFSSRERPGLWYPQGKANRVFRTAIDCEGCGLVECLERANECINRITTGEVLAACREMLSGARQQTSGPLPAEASAASLSAVS